MDIERIRSDFPLLQECIYLDSAATSLSPQPVLDAMLEFEHHYRANVGRGIHRLSQVASQKYWDAHRRVSRFIGGRDGVLAFTKNTTEAIQSVVAGIPLSKGDHVVSSILEHHSNLLPWMRLKEQKGINLSLVPPTPDGALDPDVVIDAIHEGTKLVTLTYVSNVTGAVTPVREISKACREQGALFLLDGAQAVPHLAVDMASTGCDFFCFSGHKMLGPTGTGILWMREPLSEPLLVGGGAVETVTSEGYVLSNGYERYEAGTPNVSGCIGLGRAVEYIESIGIESVMEHEAALTRQLLDGLLDIPAARVLGGDLDHRTGVVSFNVGTVKPHDVAYLLSEEADIMVRSGHHCCGPLMNYLGLPDGTVRASIGCYNSSEDVDTLLETLNRISKVS
jgi:cysteine desulfurase/selenocysteine lyase